MSDAFRFETSVDAHSNIFNEYLGSVVAKLSRENEDYRAVRAEIESLHEKYPKVLGVFDTETSFITILPQGQEKMLIIPLSSHRPIQYDFVKSE